MHKELRRGPFIMLNSYILLLYLNVIFFPLLLLVFVVAVVFLVVVMIKGNFSFLLLLLLCLTFGHDGGYFQLESMTSCRGGWTSFTEKKIGQRFSTGEQISPGAGFQGWLKVHFHPNLFVTENANP